MIGGIVDTIENPDMSGWEKVLSIGSSLLMMASMLIPAFTSIQGMFVGTGASAAASTGPVLGFGAAFNAALGPIGWVCLALTALVAIFAVIVTSIDTASEKAQKNFEQMSADAQRASEALEETKSAYQDLQTTIGSYQSARNKIDELTVGTVEFKAAILEANEAAQKLIETYGIASKFNPETGLIEIDNDDLESAVEKQQEKLEDARVANAAAQSNKLMASNNLKNAKLSEKDDTGYWDKVGNSIRKNVMFGLTAGVIEAGIGTIQQNKQNEKQMAALESLQDAYIQSRGNLEVAMDSLTASEKSLINSLQLTDSELANLCSEVSANTAAIIENNKQIVDENFADNQAYKNSAHKEELNTILATKLADETDRLYEEQYKDGSGMTDKKAQQAYAEMMGYTWVKNKDGNLGVYSKGDGSEDFTISDETARRALAQQAAIEALEGSVESYNEALIRVNETGEKFGDNIKGVGDLMVRMAGGNGASFSDANNSQIEAIQTAINNATDDLGNIKTTDIITNADAQALGYKDATDYVEGLQRAIASYYDDLEAVGEGLSDSIFQGFRTIEELSVDDAESIAKNLTSTFKIAGTDIANTLDGIFVAAGDDADELSTLLEGVNWGDPNAVNKLNSAIKEQGLDVDTSSEAWKQYTAAMSAAGMAIDGTISKFNVLRQTMADVNVITGDLKLNSIISDEDYEKLLDINPLIKDMFMIAVDGYKFIGDKGDLSTLLTGDIEKNFQGVKEQFTNIRKEMSRVDNSNWFDEDGNKVFSSDSNIAQIAQYASDDTPLDSALAYLGVSQDSLAEASDYILKYTDENGNIFTEAEGFNQEDYDSYLSQVENFYNGLERMQQDYLEGNFDEGIAEELIVSLASSMAELNQMVADGFISGADTDDSSLNAYEKQLQSLVTSGMQTAQTLGELQNIMNQGLANGATIDGQVFADALIRIGGEYSNASDEVAAYEAALERGNAQQAKAAEESLTAAIRAGELCEQYNLSTDEVERFADQLENQQGIAKTTDKALVELAKDQKRYDRAVESAAENMDDWNDALKTFKTGGYIAADTLNEIAECYGDLIDVDGSELSTEFLTSTENLEDMQKALEGDEEAYARLQQRAGEDILARIGIDTSQYESDLALIMSMAATAEGEGLADVEAGASLDNRNFLNALTDMVNAAGMTAQQATDYLSSMGVDTEVIEEETTTPEPQTYMGAVPNIEAKTFTGSNPITGGSQEYSFPSVTYTEAPMVTEGEKTNVATSLKVTSANKSSGGGLKHSTSKNTSSGSKKGRGGGGGSSKPKKAEKVKKTDVVERYKEVNDKLDDIADAMEDASKAADRLYGADRLKQMQKVNDLLEDEIALTKEKKKEAEKYLAEDKKNLIKVGKENGVSFTFDDKGNISNYESQMTKLYEELDAAIEKANADGNADEDEQEAIQKIQDKIDAVTEAIAQYDETRELIEDLDNELDDKYYEWQDNNAEILNYKLELKMEINDMELEKVEYYLSKMKDDFYQMAEAGALMLGSLNPDTLGEDGQLGVYLQQLEDYETQLKDLEAAYANGEISQTAYIESLKEIRSGIFESLEALQELDKTMMNYYGDTIAMAQDELAKYTDQMEHHSSVLEHYSTILELTGKSNDYEALGVVLEGQAKTAENQMRVAKETMDMYKNQANDRFAEYQKALAAGDEAAAELYLTQYEEALNAANEAEEEYLSSAEDWAESLRAVLENTMSKLAQSLENTLTGGTSFDQMTTAMERAASLQEEYLTTTNQIYETNKLMRTAQQEIDKTTNSVAKNKLRGFIEETQQLQNQSELSQYELEIQQAKYDLLLAEIALEEAQDAKSMVRLQRDAEGNFGYVYTADSSAVSEAEQQLADAQNNLYNIGLEGANSYTEKYQQTMSEMYDTLQDLQQQKLDGMFETEQEYQDAVTAAKEYYYDKLKQYSNLYSIALTTDNRVVVDAWSSDFAEMTARTDDWMVAVNDYIGRVQDALTLYEEQMNTIAVETVGGDLDTIRDKTKEITDANDDLVDKITNPEDGVIKAITDEMDAVANLTGEYANLRTTIQGLMGDYEDLTETIGETIEDTIENGDDNTGTPPEDLEPPAPTEPEPSAEDSDLPTPELKVGSKVMVKKSASYWASGSSIWDPVKGNNFKVKQIKGDTILIGDPCGPNYTASGYTGWIKKSDLEGFDTGGYTGSWGSYGKLAMLHEKELVLNARDTDNFLNTMEIMERILQMLDLQTMSSQLGGILSSPTLRDPGNQVIQQHIEIEANFPEATDRFEIEEAFKSMANLASQYANRK